MSEKQLLGSFMAFVIDTSQISAQLEKVIETHLAMVSL